MTRFEYAQYGGKANAKRGSELPQAKLDEEKVKAIRANKSGLTRKKLSDLYGVHFRTIERIHYRETWTHI